MMKRRSSSDQKVHQIKDDEINQHSEENIAEKEIGEEEQDEPNLKEESECRTEVDRKEEKQCKDLDLQLQDVATKYLKLRRDWWSLERWNNYLYNTRQIDCLELPVLNAYLSEWDDDESYDEQSIFKKCRKCLKLIDKLKFAIAVCENGNEKELKLWKEGIENIQDIISRKLDYMSFMLLKNANKYMDSKCENMEYGITEGDDYIITLCLWANLYKTVRKQGTRILDFSFRLPMDIVREDCAVRIMHTIFDHVSPEKFYVLPTDENILEEAEIIDFDSTDNVIIPDNEEKVEILEENAEVMEEEKDGETEKKIEKDEEIGVEIEDEDNIQEDKIPEKEEDQAPEEDGDTEITEEDTELQSEEQFSETFIDIDPLLLPPLIEPEIQVVDSEEYFVVGGIFHFELFNVPKLTEHKGGITYIHREPVKLRRIQYKKIIIPPRTLDGDTSDNFSAYEKMRFRKELSGAIYVRLQLPNKVILLGEVKPARLFLDKGGYSTDCIFETKYNKDTRQISFKTNQFGIFGMLQKKYENFPYKDWSLKGGDFVYLILKGKYINLEIQISHEGYTVISIDPCNDLILAELKSTWMVAHLLMEKLRSVGINIVHECNAHKFADITKKFSRVENKVYDCIALLSGNCSFKPVKNPISRRDKILLEFSIVKEEETKKILMRKDRVQDIETKQQRTEVSETEKEAEVLNTEESILEELEPEKDTGEGTKIENEIVQEASEMENEIISEGIDEEPFYSDLYNFVIAEMDETQKENVSSTNVCLIENVRTLLRICRPISSTSFCQ